MSLSFAMRIARKYGKKYQAGGGVESRIAFDPDYVSKGDQAKTPNVRVMEGHQEFEQGYAPSGHEPWDVGGFGSSRPILNIRGQELEAVKTQTGGAVEGEGESWEPPPEPLEAGYPEPPPEPAPAVKPPLAPVPPGQQALTEYHPTVRERMAQALIGEKPPSPEREQFVRGLLGTTGLGEQSFSLADVTPVGMGLGAQESLQHGQYQQAAMSIMPGAVRGAGAMETTAEKYLAKLAQKEMGTFHPKLNEEGNPVKILNPDQPTLPGTWDNPEKTAVFTPHDAPIPDATINGIPLQSYPTPESWKMIPGRFADEPPFKPHPKLKSASGVVIVEPDGRIWLSKPTNQYGGYQATFPKGGVEEGLSMQENAIKEAHEETGLKVKLTGLLGDFDKETSRTRYYLGQREAGHPTDMNWEMQSVHLATPEDAAKLLNKPADQNVLKALMTGQKGTQPHGIWDIPPEQVAGFKQITGALGTHPGGAFVDPDGQKWYVKQVQSLDHAKNEKLASELYKLAGVPHSEVYLTQLKGKPAIATKWIGGEELNKIPPEDYFSIKDLHAHLPADVWTANYDAVGTGKNNMIITPDNQAKRIDLGGALRYRAMGAPKKWWGPNVTEHQTMLDPKTNWDASQVFDTSNYHPQVQNFIKSAQAETADRIANVGNHQINHLVDRYGPEGAAAKKKLEEELKSRRDQVAQIYGGVKKDKVPPTDVTPQNAATPVATPISEPRDMPPIQTGERIFEYGLEDPKADAKKLLLNHEYGQGEHATGEYDPGGMAMDMYRMASDGNQKHVDQIYKLLPKNIQPDVNASLSQLIEEKGFDPWAHMPPPEMKPPVKTVTPPKPMQINKLHSTEQIVESLKNLNAKNVTPKQITSKQKLKIQDLLQQQHSTDAIAHEIKDFSPAQKNNVYSWLSIPKKAGVMANLSGTPSVSATSKIPTALEIGPQHNLWQMIHAVKKENWMENDAITASHVKKVMGQFDKYSVNELANKIIDSQLTPLQEKNLFSWLPATKEQAIHDAMDKITGGAGAVFQNVMGAALEKKKPSGWGYEPGHEYYQHIAEHMAKPPKTEAQRQADRIAGHFKTLVYRGIDIPHGIEKPLKGEFHVDLSDVAHAYSVWQDQAHSPTWWEKAFNYPQSYSHKAPAIHRAWLDTRDYIEVDGEGKNYGYGNSLADNMRTDLQAKGINPKGAIIRNVADMPSGLPHPKGKTMTTYRVWDKSTKRSEFARFDPEHFGKAGPLLGLAGGLVSGYLVEGPNDGVMVKGGTPEEHQHHLSTGGAVGYARGGAVKASKEKVHYRVGTRTEHCGHCTMFRTPDSCTAVSGKIRWMDTCDLFEKVK